MKKIITILILIVGMTMYSQNYNQSYSKRDKPNYIFVGLGIDVRNALIGSKPTNDKSELDLNFKIGAIHNKIELLMFYENFNRITFQAYGVNVNYVQPILSKTDIVIGLEAGSIIRASNSNFLTGGGNIELRHQLKDFTVAFQGNARIRPDIWYKNTSLPIKYSGFIVIYYKFN